MVSAVRRFIMITLLFMAMTGLAASPVAAAIFVVDTEADAPDAAPGDGFCRAAGPVGVAGRCTLRAAIDEANASADTYIYLPAGVYRLTYVDSKRRGFGPTLRITSNVRITGPNASSTIIDGVGRDTVMYVSKFHPPDPSVNVHLEGVTLTGGRATAPGEKGGGLAVGEAQVWLRACAIFKNQANVGGGIWFDGPGKLSLSFVTVSGNEALRAGGGIFVEEAAGDLSLRDTIVSENRAEDGGGLASESRTHLVILRGEVARNISSNRGGGLFLTGGSSVVEQVRILANVARLGGGIFADGVPLTTFWTEIAGNKASLNGGGLYLTGGTKPDSVAVLQYSAVTENRAGQDGGGLFNETTLDLADTTVSGNQATGYGGGFLNAGGRVDLSFVTIYANEALAGGGFVNRERDDSADELVDAPVFYRSSILARNSAPGCLRIGSSRFAGTSRGTNLLDDKSCEANHVRDRPDIFSAAPRLGPLATNGGLTRNHEPLPGSPAIDAPSHLRCFDGVDQRGFRRPSGPHCDIGAIEVQQVTDQPPPDETRRDQPGPGPDEMPMSSSLRDSRPRGDEN